MDALRSFVENLRCEMLAVEDKGAPVDYIPSLSKVDLNQFNISIQFVDGRSVSTDDQTQFSIQSISKLFALAIAMRDHGEAIWGSVNTEVSSNGFADHHELRKLKGHPPNPFVNSGALTVVDFLVEKMGFEDASSSVLDLIRRQSGSREVYTDLALAADEKKVGMRNSQLLQILREFGTVNSRGDDILTTYYGNCATTLSCRDLARAGLMFATRNGSGNGSGGLSQFQLSQLSSLMMTCGQYDYSGRFSHLIGLPAKSGVGGGILAIVPNVASIAVYSPGLNASGVSKLGVEALKRVCQHLSWDLYSAA